MIMLPFPLFVAEFVIFVLAAREWGFFYTLGLYLLPCLLGFFIVSTVGRMALMTMQSTVTHGKLPGSKILHSGAIFLSGILFLVPAFSTRIFGLILLLPGLRHLAVWRFKIYMAKQMAKGTSSFRFGGAGGGPFGFRYYQYGNGGGFGTQQAQERNVHETNVLDVTPLKVTHEEKKNTEE
jgi:UPF0716 protein FxsA